MRTLSKHAPKVRPTGHLPFLTRTPAANGAGSGGTRSPRTVGTPPAPTLATANAGAAAALPSFTGVAQSTSVFTDGEPPDPWVAVGPEHIVQAVNLMFRTTDRAGGSAVDVSMADFFNLPTNPVSFNSDPHVIYDSLHGRWIATEVSWDCDTTGGSNFGTGYIDYAVSDTTDPNGTWHLDYLPYPDQLPDFPAPGTSTDKVAIASNVFDMTTGGNCVSGLNYAGTNLDVLDWADLLNPSTDLYTEFSSGDLLFDFRVATQIPATSPKLQAVAMFQDDDVPGQLDTIYYLFKGGVRANTLDIETAFDLEDDSILAPSIDPPQPVQAGPDTIDTAVDLRFTDAIWQGNRLVFTSTYPCGAGPRDCVRVTELNTALASLTVRPTRTQDFLINEAGKDLFMGGIGLAGDGTLHVGWTRSSLTDSPSSFAAHQSKGQAAGSISAAELLAAGTASYDGERWGDYVGIAQDPQVPNQVWNANQYSGGTEWLIEGDPAPDRRGDVRADGARTDPRHPRGDRPQRTVRRQLGPDLDGRRRHGDRRECRRDHRQRDGRRPAVGRVGLGHRDPDRHAAVVHDQLPARGDPREQPRRAAVVQRDDLGRLQGHIGQGDPPRLRRHRVLPGRQHGRHVQPDHPGPGDRYARRHRASPASSSPIRRARSSSPARWASPSGRRPITGNVVIVQPSKLGSGAVTKDPTATPSTSTVNFPAHTNRANGVFAPLTAAGELSIVYNAAAGGTADVVLDITGYFMHDLTGLKFVPLNPSRIVDTRPPAVLSGLHGKLATGVAKTLQVSGHWGVPDAAVAVTGNMTVTGSTANGSVSATPDPDNAPTTSTINFTTGAVIANGFVGPLNGAGEMSFTYLANSAGKTTDLVIDLSGYFQ